MCDWVSIIVALVVGFIGGLCAAGATRAMRERAPRQNEKKKKPTMRDKEKVKRNIYVGNLAHEVTEEDLKKAFSPFGNVVSTVVVLYELSISPA